MYSHRLYSVCSFCFVSLIMGKNGYRDLAIWKAILLCSHNLTVSLNEAYILCKKKKKVYLVISSEREKGKETGGTSKRVFTPSSTPALSWPGRWACTRAQYNQRYPGMRTSNLSHLGPVALLLHHPPSPTDTHFCHAS